MKYMNPSEIRISNHPIWTTSLFYFIKNKFQYLEDKDLN
jgi:hypothetical protein